MVTYAKLSPKMVNPRDIPGNAEEEVSAATLRLKVQMELAEPSHTISVLTTDQAVQTLVPKHQASGSRLPICNTGFERAELRDGTERVLAFPSTTIPP